MEEYTWNELESLADKIRTIRDQFLDQVPVHIFAILYRNLKLLEQEIRILTETNNFLKRWYGEETPEYIQHHQELLLVKVEVKLKKINLSSFGQDDISPSVLIYIIPFMEG